MKTIIKSIKFNSWNNWLLQIEDYLIKRGYRKFDQKLKGEDFTYWKTFYRGRKHIYQVGVRFYDFRKHQRDFNIPESISVSFDCMILGNDDRIDMTVSKDITIAEFEKMSKAFYNSMKVYF
jgi:hypothetical protein